MAQRARDAGIEIFAIGVGRVEMSTLRQMASDPLDDHVDYVESYSVIEKLTKKFQEAFCGKLGRGDVVVEVGGGGRRQGNRTGNLCQGGKSSNPPQGWSHPHIQGKMSESLVILLVQPVAPSVLPSPAPQ